MPIWDNPLAVEAIEEYLTAAKACVDTTKPNGGILGCPATLLLLCATDAIGHGVLPDNGKFTRLDVLKRPPFDLELSDTQVGHLTKWYRHLLAHTGTIAPGAFLTPDAQGKPFDFDTNDMLTVIRVPVLYDVVKAAWERLDKTGFNPPRLPKSLPDPLAQSPNFTFSITSTSSGTATSSGTTSPILKL